VKRQTLVELIAFVALVTSCVFVRLAFQDLPNFAPVAAAALFAGYFFRSGAMALCVPLTAMAVSDFFIGGYDWRMMAMVYGTLSLPVALRGPLRHHLAIGNGRPAAWGPVAGLLSCSLAASLLFFFVTNFGCWLWMGAYEHSAAGLVHCYVQALPFFRYTLAGDTVFGFVLFGGYWLAARGMPAAKWNAELQS
jgi:hypothetical protein